MKKIILTVLAILSISFFSPLVAGQAYAACGSDADPKGQVKQGLGDTGSNCEGTGVGTFISTVVKVLSIVVGVAAIIMIIISGFKYIASGGDAGKIASAKNTLIYALVGIAVAALAQILVNFAYSASSDAANPPPPKSATP